MNYFIAALKKYADFSGRARRKEYWMFVLFYTLFAMVAGILDVMIISTAGIYFTPILTLFLLGMIIPTLAISVRRMHDIGKSDAMILIPMVPFIGSIWYLILTVTEGNVGDNQYGPHPKATSF
ncbi:DUF805 domain-containing protein [Carboxylicivirga sediminis]|uniref:DUF805 domain-containing protein n=1 Tax=Carboxylicivirga sediminis TaxID=2006564 RepID=A0A941F7I9_9BACT|nr:DUF805 domain-containing protein [Carboxylicivirga sediminis]MBR8537100.1 DUF805 domain-containing protein [Carboxylicivirga sediminis]